MKNFFYFILTCFYSSNFVFALSEAEAVISGEKFYQNIMTYLFNPLLQLITVIAFLYFLYGVMIFLWNRSNNKAGTDINEGKNHLIYGLIGLFIIFSVNAILAILNDSVGGLFQ